MLIGLLLVGAAALGIWGVGSMLFREVGPLNESDGGYTPSKDNDFGVREADLILDPEYSSLSCNIHYSDDTETGYEY